MSYAMDHWDKIRTEIFEEVKDVFEQETTPKIDIHQAIDLFLKVLIHPLDDPAVKLDGLVTRVPNALENILLKNLSRIDKNSFFPDVVKVEPFLRKILFIIDEQKYYALSSKKEGLLVLIEELDLNPNKINFNWDKITGDKKTFYSEHLLKVYKLRNLESHNCERWSHSRLYVELKSALVIYLFATHTHAKKLQPKVDKGNTTNYLNTVIRDYKKWQSRFVHIRGIEEVEKIDLYAKEVIDDDPVSCNPAREGKIADIRREIPEHQIIILGAPGMGKSTTLQYLACLDAQDILAKKTSDIRCPIFIELKLLAETDSIMQKITDKFGIEKSYVIEHLKGGKTSLFLDGLNEIEKSIKQRTIIEIKKIIAQFPQLHMIISSRPQEYEHRYFNDTDCHRKIPVFMLQQMKNDQINDFLEKNCINKSARMTLRHEFSRNQNWYDLVSTPLILYMLIQIVQSNRNKLPDNKATIIKEFIRNISIREKKEKDAAFDYETLHVLLCHLGFETRTLADTNAALDRDEFIIPILEERKKSYGLTVNLLDVLNRAVDLNILSKDENQYSFVHEVYQEYYAAEELIKRKNVD